LTGDVEGWCARRAAGINLERVVLALAGSGRVSIYRADGKNVNAAGICRIGVGCEPNLFADDVEIVRSRVSNDPAGNSEGPVGVRVKVVGQVLQAAVVRIGLTAWYQNGEEVSSIAQSSREWASVDPDKILSIIYVAIDGWVAVLAMVRPVHAFVYGGESSGGHCRSRSEHGDERWQSHCRDKVSTDSIYLLR